MSEAEDLSGAPAPVPGWLLRLAAAIEAAVPAALAVLSWFAVHSLLLREPWWSKFNVAAAPFLGDRVFFLGLGRATLAGAALLVVCYSLLGILYGCLAAGRATARALLLAMLWLTLWHFFSQQYVWYWLDPSAPSYFPFSATAPAHAAAAILLARFPAVLRRLSALGRGFPPAATARRAPPEPDVAHGAGAEGRPLASRPGQRPCPPDDADC